MATYGAGFTLTIVPYAEQQKAVHHCAFLNALARAVNPEARGIIVTDAVISECLVLAHKITGMGFCRGGRGRTLLNVHEEPEKWQMPDTLKASNKPEYLGPGTLSRANYARCAGHFYLHKRAAKGRKNQRARYRIKRCKQERDGRAGARAPWLIFISTDEFKPREIMKIYSRRMQIEQNFRDEKSERFGSGLRATHSRAADRILALSLLAPLSSVVLWLLGYHFENRGLHLRYQANR